MKSFRMIKRSVSPSQPSQIRTCLTLFKVICVTIVLGAKLVHGQTPAGPTPATQNPAAPPTTPPPIPAPANTGPTAPTPTHDLPNPDALTPGRPTPSSPITAPTTPRPYKPPQQVPSTSTAKKTPSTTTARPTIPAPSMPPKASETSAVMLPGEQEFNDCIKIPAGRRIKVTLKPESELTDLVSWISSMTCKRFILPAGLRSQKVTIVSPTPISAGEAYRAFYSALDTMGITIVPSGRFLKLIQSNTAVQSAVPVFGARQGGYIPNTERIITQVIRPASANANDILSVLNKLKSRNGDVTVYKPSNALIVTDSGTNIRRMMKIVRELDIPAEGEKIWVVRLRYATGKDIQKLLGQLFNGKGKRSSKTFKPASSRSVTSRHSRSGDDFDTITASKIVTDSTSNSLIIVASESSFHKIHMLIKRLDVEGTGLDQRIHVYYLENADATELSKTLSNLANGSKKSKGKSSSATAALFEGEVKISADKSTNSLVIVASTQDYLSVRRVIKRLDIPRRQVFVEATIMEVTINDGLNLGLGLHAGKIVGSGLLESLIYGATNTGADSITGGLPGSGIGLGAIGAPIEGSDTLTGLPTEVPGLGIKIDAMKSNSDINVLSSPHILTTDNEEAEIVVGENLPFPGQRVPAAANAAAGRLGGVFAQLAVPIQRQDVALKLKLTPHVNDSDVVRLELSQEVSDVIAEDYGGNGNGPATSKRSIKTTIVVRDQQTVVIGGLIRDKDTRSETKIPLLGDLPLIGNLFKSVNNDKTKVNLLLVLTPYVIRDQSDLRRIFTKRMEERRDFIERYTPFEPHEAEHEVDYLHKRGLLAEINHTGIRLEEESRLIKQAEIESAEPIEPVDLLDGMDTTPESTAPASSSAVGSPNRPPVATPPPPSGSPSPSSVPNSPPVPQG